MSKLSFRSIIPNITTLIGLCFGILAICFALSGQFQLSVICILMASICDVLDGRLSRFLKSESKLGAELDSLADFLNFGIAPSILIYISLMQNAGLIERIAVLSFIVFSCLRLARFNADIVKSFHREFWIDHDFLFPSLRMNSKHEHLVNCTHKLVSF